MEVSNRPTCFLTLSGEEWSPPAWHGTKKPQHDGHKYNFKGLEKSCWGLIIGIRLMEEKEDINTWLQLHVFVLLWLAAEFSCRVMFSYFVFSFVVVISDYAFVSSMASMNWSCDSEHVSVTTCTADTWGQSVCVFLRRLFLSVRWPCVARVSINAKRDILGLKIYTKRPDFFVWLPLAMDYVRNIGQDVSVRPVFGQEHCMYMQNYIS